MDTSQLRSKRRRALIALYHHTSPSAGVRLPASHRPLPLKAAIKELSQTELHSRDIRHICALRLNGSDQHRHKALELLKDHAPQKVQEILQAHRGEIQRHAEQAKEKLNEAKSRLESGPLQQVQHLMQLAGSKLPSFGEDNPLSQAKQQLVSALGSSSLDDALATPDSQAVLRQPILRQHIASSAEYDPNTLITTAKVHVRVKRPLWELVRLLRPAGWADSAPDYFQSTYWVANKGENPVVDQDASGRPEGRPLSQQPDFDTYTGGDKSFEGVFYENFEWDWTVTTLSAFRNFLNTSYAATDETIDLEFSLRRCLQSQVGPMRRSGGLDVDSGYTRARLGADGWIDVEAIKNVRFTDLTDSNSDAGPMDPGLYMNYLAPSIVGSWMDQLVYAGLAAPLPTEAS